jgi:mannose-6-phosphate isomerase class I
MNSTTSEVVARALDETKGILKLKPTYVRRFYKDGGRLGLRQNPGDTFKRSVMMWVPERWVASTVTATNPNPIPGEGLSFLDLPGKKISLQFAISLHPEALLGPKLLARYGAKFPVLNKIFDPYDPIVFHFHARDADVQKFPKQFNGHTMGKDEAYYFLPRPKGRVAYTHVGLYPGVTAKELEQAIERGGDHSLELSPVFAQRFEEGFYVPAGVPHRPGTALTLEIQQPSDVYTLLESASGDNKLSHEQIHPGFDRLKDALRFIDLKGSQNPHILQEYRLVPLLIPETQQLRGGEEWWIFPPQMTQKFSGKRLRVTGTFEVKEKTPHALLVWNGRGELNGRAVRPGDEFLVSFRSLESGYRLKRGGAEVLEVFKLFPPQVES